MIKRHQNILFSLAVAATASFGSSQQAAVSLVHPQSSHAVDLVICLDTSGSMQGLINAARQNIWAIVNDLALASPSPKLRIALLTYGNNGHQQSNNWVEIQTGLTDDLDLVSQKLFALTTNGGEEYVGAVLQNALDNLEWSGDAKALKLIVVAGNEAASQGGVDFRAECRRAIQRGIMVNSIYCGGLADAVVGGWRDVAKLSDGQFASIDKDNGDVVIESPFDTELSTLSAALNDTYLPYGSSGAKGKANQVAQDRNADATNNAAAAQRAWTKATCNYVCSWDLVDACKQKDFKLEDLKVSELPKAMQTMTVAQQRTHIETMGKKRADLQKQIATLNVKRESYVAGERKKRAVDASKSFEFAVRQAVRGQARAAGLEIARPAQPAPDAKPDAKPSAKPGATPAAQSKPPAQATPHNTVTPNAGPIRR